MPVSMIEPCTRDAPEEYSLGTDDIIANRLDAWHGAGFHPYSFMHLDVLAWAFGP